MRIRLIVDGETLPAVLEDNPAGRDFLSMLPLTLTVKDYNGTEKIGNPPRVISTEDMPDSIEPSAGDLTFYARGATSPSFTGSFACPEDWSVLGASLRA